MPSSADVVICGAGIAGISTAYQLSVNHGMTNITLVDERPPLSLTSDKSTEAYRNWWPGPDNAMTALMNRSIDRLEDIARQSDNRIHLNRRGYLYVTGDPDQIPTLRQTAENAARQGAGPVRVHTGRPGEPAYVPPLRHGFDDPLTGADLLLDPALIRQHFPYITEKAVAAVHVRRCGWLSGYDFGMWMLEQARARGVRLVEGRVDGVEMAGNRVTGVTVSGAAGQTTIQTRRFVSAAGPFTRAVGHMMGLDLPVFSELHLKIAVKDHLGVIPRDAPMTIWVDPQYLSWSAEEREFLADDPDSRWLLEEFPDAVHFRPEGEGDSQMVLMLWPYHTPPTPEVFPLPDDVNYPEVVVRGLTTLVPGLSAYLDRMPKPYVDGGYYTKTKENRPLIGPLPVDGAYLIGALSGFGLMAAAASGELLAAHIAGSALPDYAAAFLLSRYQDPAYQQLLSHWGDVGQL